MRTETFTKKNNGNIGIAHLFWAYHSSLPCTGTSIVNKNLNASKLTAQKLAHHRKCRRCVSNAQKLVTMYKRGGFVESKFTSCYSGEQLRFASFHAVALEVLERLV